MFTNVIFFPNIVLKVISKHISVSNFICTGYRKNIINSRVKRRKSLNKKRLSLSIEGGLSIEELQKQLQFKKDHTEENIRQLQQLSNSNINPEFAKKAFKRATKAKIEDTLEPVEKKTVFSEEDFENFEKEYFAS